MRARGAPSTAAKAPNRLTVRGWFPTSPAPGVLHSPLLNKREQDTVRERLSFPERMGDVPFVLSGYPSKKKPRRRCALQHVGRGSNSVGIVLYYYLVGRTAEPAQSSTLGIACRRYTAIAALGGSEEEVGKGGLSFSPRLQG